MSLFNAPGRWLAGWLVSYGMSAAGVLYATIPRSGESTSLFLLACLLWPVAHLHLALWYMQRQVSDPESRTTRENALLIRHFNRWHGTASPPLPAHEVVNPALLDSARRRASWEAVTPLAFVAAGVAGVFTASLGFVAMLAVMLAVATVAMLVGELLCLE